MEETHWSVKMPVSTTLRMPMLARMSRRLVQVRALSVVLVTTISPGCGASSGMIRLAALSFGRSR